MENMIIAGILLVIISGIVIYFVRAKKRGDACIGCPHGKQCSSGKCGGSCNNDIDHDSTE